MSRWRRNWEDTASEALPVDVYPCSNGEFVPPPPTSEQRAIMDLAERETERWRRKFNMSRRDFVRTTAAMTIGFWAIDAVTGGTWGRYAQGHNTSTTGACDLEWDDVLDEATGLSTLSNRPGEFIFDVQSHHVDPQGLWRVTNPGFMVAFAALWPQAGPLGGMPGVRDDGSVRGFGAGEIDPMENLSRFHYLKELFLDSATTATVLSTVPSSPDVLNALPFDEALKTAQTVEELTGSGIANHRRTVLHGFVMPNRGSAGMNTNGSGVKPLFLQDELDLMEVRAQKYGYYLRGWKTYCAWGDVPNSTGWTLDSEEIGFPFLEQVRNVSAKYGIPPVVATHKGFALPAFDQRGAAPRDVGPAARAFPDIRFIVYHSGHDIGEGPQTTYDPDSVPDDPTATSGRTRSVDAFIKSLIGAGVDGPSNGGNSPNVWAELGSVWRDYMSDATSASHLLGKLIHYVGPKRVVWGTDSLWYGSPQREIVALRSHNMGDAAKELYGLPFGLDGDVENPNQAAPSAERTIRNAIFGRNAAEAYEVPIDTESHQITCTSVNALREGYILDAGTPRERAPLASNQMAGARTRRAFLTEWRNKPWSP